MGLRSGPVLMLDRSTSETVLMLRSDIRTGLVSGHSEETRFRPRTFWRDCKSSLVWEHQEELDSGEMEVWVYPEAGSSSTTGRT